MKKNQGFTLIELLVVIAIIGILASVVLASLSSARAKGQAAAVQASLANMRSQAEIYYSTNGNYGTGYAAAYYGAAGTDVTPTSSCGTTVGTGMFGAAASAGGLDGLIKGACNAGGTVIKVQTDAATATKWALQATAPRTNGYCVDSSGTSKSYGGTPTAFTTTNAGTCL